MAFIPVIARADITENGSTPTATIKKGKITPAQMAVINAWTLASKNGVLNVRDKCAATASTVDSNNKSTVTFGSGYIVIYGRLIECESNTTVEINTLEHPSGKIILSVDLKSIKQNEVKIQVVSSSYSLKKDDLNEVPTSGEYDYELYSYTTSGTTVTLKQSFGYIYDVGSLIISLTDLINTNSDKIKNTNKKLFGTDNAEASGSPPLQNYDGSKGTIEERLTALGFKNGVLSFCGTRYASSDTAYVKRQGNYVIGYFKKSLKLTTDLQYNYLYEGATLFQIFDNLNATNGTGFKSKTGMPWCVYMDGGTSEGNILGEIIPSANIPYGKITKISINNQTLNKNYTFHLTFCYEIT